jgi:hypothetical protein
VLVSGQRNGGALSATLDAVLVRADGWTRLDKRHGGAGRRYDDFRLRADAMRRLRAALARLPARPPHDAAATGRGASYLLRYRGTTYYAVADAVPRSMRCRTSSTAAGAPGASPRCARRRRERPRGQPPRRARARGDRPPA